MTQAIDATGQPTRRRWQFRLRSVMLVTALVGVVIAIVSLKLQQDFRRDAAIRELNALSMAHTIKGLDGNQTQISIVCRREKLPDRDVERLLVALGLLQRSHDLGLSAGLQVVRVDLGGCEISSDAVTKLRAALPDAEIRR